MKTPHRIALAGNPNAGKTSLFNALTGTRQHVGNWPGKTVERKSGRCTHQGIPLEIVDLPGAYSLSAFSPEELIARDYLLQERPHLIIIVLDAANLERNLYLAVQLLELDIPAVIALNMMDVASARGLHIDVAQLSRSLGAPVVETIARHNAGVTELLDVVIRTINETAYAHA